MILNINKYKIIIEKRYKTFHPIISVGSDCHPAHILDYLKLRKKSYPFDWVYTIAYTGIEYVNDNIKTEFKKFVDKIVLNKWGEVASAWYENSAFFHFEDLLENKELQFKLYNRGKRFLKIFNRRKCKLLHCLTFEGLTCKDEADRFIKSVYEFHTLSTQKHDLHIYIRFDESIEENKEFCDYTEKKLNTIPNTYAVKYVRHFKEYGVWGNENEYLDLLKSLGIKIFPTIKINVLKHKMINNTPFFGL